MPITYPSKAPDGRPFGDVGTYVKDTNTLDTSTHDNLLVWLDVEAIEDYYKNVNIGTPMLTKQQMIDAGFGQDCGDSDTDESGQTVTYKTFLDIPYKVHEVTEQHDEFATVTAYERLIRHLQTCMGISVPGDINLDGKYTDEDFVYAEEVYEECYETVTPCKNLIYEKETTLKPNKSVTHIYQRLHNAALYSRSMNITEGDIAVLRDMLSNIYNITDFLVDTAKFSGNDASFSIKLGKQPEKGIYCYSWELEQSDGSFEPLGNVERTSELSSTRVIASVTPEQNGKEVRVSIYEPYVDNIPTGTPLTDTDYYHARTYSSNVYVGSLNNTLWGDTDNNGSVNIIDAYNILNNYNYLRGDVDRNGIIDAIDASMVLHYYGLLSTGRTPQEAVDFINEDSNIKYTVEDFERCDMNMDGRTDASDASNILSIYGRLATGSSIEEIEKELGITIDPANLSIPTKSKGDLAALVKMNNTVRPAAIIKDSGLAILDVLKDNTKSFIN